MKILVGDILQSKAQTLVNTVNCVGVMGKGIALEFKKRFPTMFEDYVKRCERGEVHLGVPYLYERLLPPQIVLFPTKDHWRSISRAQDIESGMDYLLEHYRSWGITSMAIPPLGCGNGQLEWCIVGPIIYQRSKQMGIPVEIYAPYGTPPSKLTVKFLENPAASRVEVGRKRPSFKLNPAWVALVEILCRIEEQPYHWPVGRTIFQKIAYVATQQGLPTGFQYERGSFGPFSRELKEALAKLVNENLIQEQRQGNSFIVKVGPEFDKAEKRFRNNLDQWRQITRKTTDLFMRLDTKQAEVVATVLFAADALRKDRRERPSEKDVLDYIMNWKQRRRPPLDAHEVANAIRNLGMLNWLETEPSFNLPVPQEELASF